LIRSNKPWNWGTDANIWITAQNCIAQKGHSVALLNLAVKLSIPTVLQTKISAITADIRTQRLAALHLEDSAAMDGDFTGMLQIYSLELKNTC
jgi:hypothetical protein